MHTPHGSAPLTTLANKAMAALRRWERKVPSSCAVCHQWPAQRICQACAAHFAQPTPRCQRCAIAVPVGVGICGACVLSPPAVDQCYAAVDYAHPWADVVHGFKFGSDPGWASSLAQLMRSMPWVEPALDAANVLLPIPLAPERLRERGYNQAALLAKALSPRKTDPETLLRMHWTPPQSGLSRAQRLRNLQGAFAVNPERIAQVQGQHVLLVDDVMTTGATLDAAANTLRAAGAAKISALVLARTGVD